MTIRTEITQSAKAGYWQVFVGWRGPLAAPQIAAFRDAVGACPDGLSAANFMERQPGAPGVEYYYANLIAPDDVDALRERLAGAAKRAMALAA